MMDVHLCPDAESLRRYCGGELDEESSSHVALHVDSCDSCAAALRRYRDRELGDQSSAASATPADGTATVAARLPSQEPLELVPPLVAEISPPSSLGTGAPSQLGPYRLLALIGRGGMGAVYRAVHTRLGKEVALKTLPLERLTSPDAIERFDREMKAVGRLEHPNLVRATDAGEAAGVHYLAMELIDGLDLGKLVRRLGPLPVADACELVQQAAAGLGYVHSRQLVHRDVKPSNLMLTNDGEVKVLDLGLARLAEARDGGMTSSSSPLGTVDYMAPEQAADSRRVDGRTDLYSLGCTLHYLLTGRPPFATPERQTPVQTIVAHATATPPRAGAVRSDVPAALDDLLATMLAKSPADRPDTADVVARLAPLSAGADLRALAARVHDTEKPVAAPLSVVPVESTANLPRPKSFPIDSAPAPATQARVRRRSPTRPVLACLALAAFAAVAATIVYLQLGKGTLLIEIDDALKPESLAFKLDGDRVVIVGDGTPVRVRAGDHELSVERDGLAASTTKPFTLSRQGKVWLRVTQLDGKLAIVDAASRAAPTPSTPPPQIVVPAATGESAPGLPAKPPLDGSLPKLGAWQPGPAENVLPGLIPRPAKLPGIGRWNIETIVPQFRATSLSWRPDGQMLACAAQRVVRVFDVPTRRLERIFVTDSGPDWSATCALAWSADGQRLARITGRNTEVWDVETGRTAFVLEGHTAAVLSIGWSSDGRWLATGGRDRCLRLWHAADGKAAVSIENQPGAVTSLAWSPDSSTIAAACEDSTLRLFACDRQKADVVLEGHQGAILALAWNVDGSHIASGAIDRSIRIWDIAARKTVTVLDGLEGPVQALDWNTATNWLASYEVGNHIRFWDLAAAKPTSRPPTKLTFAVFDWKPDGTALAVGGDSTTIALLSPSGDFEPFFVPLGAPPSKPFFSRAFEDVAWSRDGLAIATACTDAYVRVWDATTGRLRIEWKGHDGGVNGLSWHPTENQIATASWDKTVGVWNASGGEKLHKFSATAGGGVKCVAWSPDGDRLASAGIFERDVRVWDVAREKLTEKYGSVAEGVQRVDWSADKRWIAAAYLNAVHVWSASNPSIHREFAGATQFAWSPEGQTLAFAKVGPGQGVTLFNLDNESSTKLFHRNLLADTMSLRWSPDGRRFVTAKASRRWGDIGWLWPVTDDATDGVFRIGSQVDSPVFPAWSPDSRQFALGTWGGVLRVFDSTSGEPRWLSTTLDDGSNCSFTAAGEQLDGDRAADERLVYLVDTGDGRIRGLKADEFRQLVDSNRSKPAPDGPSKAEVHKFGADDFFPLFNGTDLTGWKTHSSQPGKWRVENGVLIGSGPASYLFSERGDFTNLHVRVEVRINSGGNSGVYCRSTFDPGPYPGGYEAQVENGTADPNKTGSLYGEVSLVNMAKSIVQPNEWFTLELTAIDNHVVVKVNGQTTADYVDPEHRFKTGHIALQHHDPRTIVEFRKIEVKELPATAETTDTGASVKTEELPALGQWSLGPGRDVLPGLAPRPAALPGLGRWQVETAAPRSSATAIGFSPDGSQIAVTTTYGALRVYDAETLKLSRCFLGHTGLVDSLGWSRDGRWLASCGVGFVRTWNVESGAPGPTFPNYRAMSVSWGLDHRLAFAGGHIDICDPTSGQARRFAQHYEDGFSNPGGRPLQVQFSPDGRWLASVGLDLRARLWDVETGASGPEFPSSYRYSTQLIAWSPDSKRLAIAGEDERELCIWDVETKQRLHTLGGHSQALTSVAWSNDGTLLATAEMSGQIRLWNAADGSLSRTLVGHEWITFVAFDPRGDSLASAGWDMTVRTWDLKTGEPKKKIGHGLPFYAACDKFAWQPEGGKLAVHRWGESAVHLWNTKNSPPRKKIALPSNLPAWKRPNSLAWSHGGRSLAIGGEDGVIRLASEPGFEPDVELAGAVSSGEPITDVAFAPDDKRLAAVDGGSNVLLWDVAARRLVAQLPGHKKAVRQLAWSPSGRWLSSADDDAVRFWRGDNGAPGPVLEFRAVPLKFGAAGLSWTGDWLVASGGQTNAIQVWDAESQKVVYSLLGQAPIAARPGHREFACYQDSALVVRSIKTGAISVSVPIDPGECQRAFAWSPGGRYLAYDSPGRAFYVHDVDDDKPLWFAVHLPSERFARFTAAGELLSLSDDAEDEIAYVVEEEGGKQQTLNLAEFRQRAAATQNAEKHNQD